MPLLLLMLCAVFLAGCATTTTQLAPVAREDVRAEESVQRELVITELARAQERLDNIAYPLMAAATPVCAAKSGPRLGFSLRSAHGYTGVWAPAARAALRLSDTLSVTAVVGGSPAALAGLEKGDRLLAVNGVEIPIARSAVETATKALQGTSGQPFVLTVRRADGDHQIRAQPEVICNLGAIVTLEGDLNAYADGKSIIFPWMMMRFANDDELRAVIAHEIAHNAMGHIEARQKNAALAGFFGLLADVALASQGYNTRGENTASFMRLGAQAFSQDFEREADYVGMYIMARAGVSLTSGPNLWRQFAQINPAAIGYASTHPTTAERFVRLRTAIEEIENKRRVGRDLLPEMKVQR
ncbi:MAG: M48 family metalloprotease [Longimicrobiales bacterium]